jgi:hypothetical protein
MDVAYLFVSCVGLLIALAVIIIMLQILLLYWTQHPPESESSVASNGPSVDDHT